MINLLPTQKKKDVRMLYRIQMVTAASVFFAALGLFSVAAAGVAYWGTHMEYQVVQKWVEVAKKGEEAAHVEQITEELDDMNTILHLLSHTFEPHRLLSQRIFVRIADLREGVVIHGLSYERKEDGGMVHVRGVADTREDLVFFARALETDGFAGVDIPVGSFVSESDIEFSLTFQE